MCNNFRQALNDAKKQNHNLMERVQSMQSELSDAEVTRSELDGQIRQGHTVSLISISTISYLPLMKTLKDSALVCSDTASLVL